MAEDAKPDAQLFELLASLLQQVEALSNQEEVELRAKIEALGLEVTKVPPKPPKDLDELELAAELDKLSAKLDDVDSMISSTIASNPEVCSLLSSTAVCGCRSSRPLQTNVGLLQRSVMITKNHLYDLQR